MKDAKDSVTARADSRVNKNRGMLSPKQNQNAFDRFEQDQTKAKDKH